MNRKIDKCTSCEKVDKIAGHGLCFACYRQIERAIKQKRGADAAVQPKDRRLLQLYISTINNLIEMGASPEDIFAIKKAYLNGYVTTVAMYLNTLGEEESN